jgi:GNAT superfamily N-acetyltransferase
MRRTGAIVVYMTQPPIIRPVTAADLPAWRALWAGYNAFYGRKDETTLADEITRTTWTRFFDPLEPVHALVAEQDGRLLGLTHYLFHRSTTQLGLNCYLQDLFTVEAVRGKGVGRALIEAVYGCAKEAGSPRVYWQTHETNVTAMRLYDQVAKRSGFLVYSQLV